MNNASHHFLAARIQECYRKTRQLETDLFFQRRQLEFTLGPELFEQLEEKCIEQAQYESQRSKTIQIRKFDNLLNHRNTRQPPPRQWVVNLSSIDLNQTQQSVLAKCLNYALPSKHIPTSKIVASAEDALRRTQATPDVIDKARTQIIGVLSKAKPSAPNLSPLESKALRELRQDTSLVILPADKGRATVVMDKSSYDTKVKTMLSDTTTYKILPKDPTSSLQREMNAILLSLRRSDHLSESQYNKLRSSAGHIPFLYVPLDIKTTFGPNNTLRQMLVHPKDPTPLQDKAGVVYKIPCSSCPRVYIGQTGRTLGQRVRSTSVQLGTRR